MHRSYYSTCYFYSHYDPSLYSKYGLPFCRFYRESKPSLRKMDHMMIFVMIAGSYTPICLIALHNRTGYILCALVWSIASSVFFSKDYGSHVPNGFLPYSILEWDGFVYLLSFLSFIPFREPDLDGFLPVVSSIRSVV